MLTVVGQSSVWGARGRH